MLLAHDPMAHAVNNCIEYKSNIENTWYLTVLLFTIKLMKLQPGRNSKFVASEEVAKDLRWHTRRLLVLSMVRASAADLPPLSAICQETALPEKIVRYL